MEFLANEQGKFPGAMFGMDDAWRQSAVLHPHEVLPAGAHAATPDAGFGYRLETDIEATDGSCELVRGDDGKVIVTGPVDDALAEVPKRFGSDALVVPDVVFDRGATVGREVLLVYVPKQGSDTPE